MKYYIKTFGCQMNHSDSERIAAVLEKNNFRPASDINASDLVVFNTCGVRQMAEDRVYGQIYNLKRKTQNEKRKIIVTGCLANRKDVQRRLKDKVDLFCEIKEFPKKIRKLIEFSPFVKGGFKGDFYKNSEDKNPSLTLPFAKGENSHDYLNLIPKYTNTFSAYVPIMTGCDNFCAYCVVPYARGRETSRPAEEIIKEANNLAKKGFKHIILLGQNVNSYKSPSPLQGEGARRADEGKTINFSALLQKINSIPGHFWISFVSNHPKDVTDEMIETVTKCKKVCESFHLPIQAGNDEIIKRMNRKYTAKRYLSIVKKIKAAYKKYKPGVPYAITSDIKIGFPGESKKQFLDSAKIMEKVKFDMVYFGQFSPRPGTAAWQMKDNISKAEKVRREKYLNDILKKTSYKNNKKYVGKILEVLVEKLKVDPSNLKGSTLKNIINLGKTRTMKNVKFLSDRNNLVGKFVKVNIIKANVWNLEARLDSRKR